MMTRRDALTVLAGLPVVPSAAQSPAPVLRRIVPSTNQTLILDPNGHVGVWTGPGSQQNKYGEMGLGHRNELELDTLYPITSLSNVVSAAVGTGCSFVVLADGRLLGWGSNAQGALGTTPLSEVEVTASTRPSADAPTLQAVRIDAVDVAAGGSQYGFGLALTRDGRVFAWGNNRFGRLGIGPMPVVNFKTHTPAPMTYMAYPVPVPGLSNVKAIAVGHEHALALLGDGTVRAWGYNKEGQLGDGTLLDRDRPVTVQGVSNAIAIGGGGAFSAALLADGTVTTWGSAAGGELGRPLPEQKTDASTPYPVPALVPGLKGVRSIAVGMGHVLAITQAATVMSWGWQTYGAAGLGVSGGGGQFTPKEIKGMTGVQAVYARYNRSFAVLTNGRIFCWGAPVPEFNRSAGRARDVAATPTLLRLVGLDNP
jgi:alpha-tubulin suppressor-like RCC1 family protein